MLFYEKFKRLRKENNLTQEQLAERLNVSRQAIAKWESGEGIPDIENLKQISIFFNITIDDLVKETKELKINIKKEFYYFKELEIDHIKHFDINIKHAYELTIKPNNEEKVKIEISSNEEELLEKNTLIKLDDIKNRLDVNIKSKKDINDLSINLYLPEKYINEIEIKSKLKILNIENLKFEKLEYDGNLKYVNNNSIGKIVLNAGQSDLEVNYEKFEGILEINIINSIARLKIPKDTTYKTILKGISNQFVDSIDTESSNNTIELNGINSKLIIIDK